MSDICNKSTDICICNLITDICQIYNIAF